MGTRKNALSPFVGALVVLASLFCSYASAQTVNGAFHGTVTDQSGGVVPGAKVVATSLSHGQIREVTTDSRGFYTITEEPPGITR